MLAPRLNKEAVAVLVPAMPVDVEPVLPDNMLISDFRSKLAFVPPPRSSTPLMPHKEVLPELEAAVSAERPFVLDWYVPRSKLP